MHSASWRNQAGVKLHAAGEGILWEPCKGRERSPSGPYPALWWAGTWAIIWELEESCLTACMKILMQKQDLSEIGFGSLRVLSNLGWSMSHEIMKLVWLCRSQEGLGDPSSSSPTHTAPPIGSGDDPDCTSSSSHAMKCSHTANFCSKELTRNLFAKLQSRMVCQVSFFFWVLSPCSQLGN